MTLHSGTYGSTVDSVGLKKEDKKMGRKRSREGMGRVGGEEVGHEFDQNILYL